VDDRPFGADSPRAPGAPAHFPPRIVEFVREIESLAAKLVFRSILDGEPDAADDPNHSPAGDRPGIPPHKHPEHVHTREFPFGTATVFYPEATEEGCSAAVLLDVDPVGMVRGRGAKGGAEDQYVNDRPYVASSLLSVVLSRWFNSALGGRCERKPELVATELPLEARLASVPCRGGEAFLRTLFEPLGYAVEATRHALDESMPALGPSRLFTVTLRATLLADHQFTEIVGMDVSGRVLDLAEARLKLDRLAPKQRERIRLIHGSLMYRDNRLSGFDAASVVEVIEHLDQPRLRAFERVLFESARPTTIALTTPNAEYNVKWPSLPAGTFRHQDHRFEWTRAEFQNWASNVASRFAYAVTYRPVGDEDSHVGPPTQMAVFVR
jgi:hypothetical protein